MYTHTHTHILEVVFGALPFVAVAIVAILETSIFSATKSLVMYWGGQMGHFWCFIAFQLSLHMGLDFIWLYSFYSALPIFIASPNARV